MAGLSMKDIKLRIRSMQSTKQITKAMEMVATSKLRGAQNRANRSKPYFDVLMDTMMDISASDRTLRSAYFQAREVKTVCYVVVAGDRGLAGGYNSNVFKAMNAHRDGATVKVLPMGKKAVEYAKAHGLDIISTDYAVAGEQSASNCYTLAKSLAKSYLAGEFDAVYLCYTEFQSMLSQVPVVSQLLPVPPQEGYEKKVQQTLYEPSPSAVLSAIVPEYMGGAVYGGLCQSVASELAARRTAMDAATKNAQEMIDGLSLKYNRARQSAITQEITEIVAGSDA